MTIVGRDCNHKALCFRWVESFSLVHKKLAKPFLQFALRIDCMVSHVVDMSNGETLKRFLGIIFRASIKSRSRIVSLVRDIGLDLCCSTGPLEWI